MARSLVLLLLALSGCDRLLPLSPLPDAPAPDLALLQEASVVDAPVPDAPPDAVLPDAPVPDAPPAPCELTEGNASMWQGQCNVDRCSYTEIACGTNKVSSDTTTKYQGQSSIRWDCDGCAYDNVLVVSRPGGQVWDLSAFTRLRLWIHSKVNDPSGWQDGECRDNPTIVLVDAFGGALIAEKTAAGPDLNTSLPKWILLEIPVVPGPHPQWQVLSAVTFDRAQVKDIEIHVDPYEAGFTLWVDGLTFEDPVSGARLTDCL